MSAPVRVSPNFTLAELTVTDHRGFLDEQSNPPPMVKANLLRLAVDLLEPFRALVGPLRVNSGWRCQGLNAAIGGAFTSYHLEGLAADLFPTVLSLREAFEKLSASELPFDQAILEYGRWIHVQAPRHGKEPRRQLLSIFTPGRYEPWNPNDPRVRGIDSAA